MFSPRADKWFCLWAIILLIAGCLQSCSTLEKRIAKAKLVAVENPNSFASLCGQLFPVKEVFIKGKDSVRIDSVTKTNTITVTRVIKGDTVYIDVDCPKEKVVTRTVIRTDTVVKENTANLKTLGVKYDELNTKYVKSEQSLSDAEKSAKNRIWWIVGLALVLAGSIFLHIRRIIIATR